ncbi:hypothetical protein VCHC37A1_3147A, partial [Vibrio cholerae HC-37A1]
MDNDFSGLFLSWFKCK